MGLLFLSAFSQAYQCQVVHLRQDCGQEAVTFFEKNLEQMSNSLIHQHCASYTFDNCVPKAPTSSSTSIHYLFELLLIPLLIVANNRSIHVNSLLN